ncbi:OmpH family outer membrane protein [Dokdonella fugitiva]|uniref:Outer membrane protein n=1 Tax=Dokdonella fugitiva TaxID=328517 RepID=A0A4R2I4C4_9GAMM|nr:OmpH family outer membrane protein [Dokdonella fugitiva]MBA8884066.1 outer membrane protein [Dokdonella fugitiva]TCO38762.1 outer membrane protein [Dokdonella fugitiva]
MRQPAQPARRMLALLLVPLFALAGAASAQAPAPTRIGYVDMKRLLDNAPQVVAGRRKLEREFATRDAALKADEQRLAELHRKQATLAKDEADALQREIDALDRSIKRSRDAMRAELKTRSDQELDRSWREINEAVVEFARDQGYDLIVPSPVVYASPRVDITDRILERLRREGARGATP